MTRSAKELAVATNLMKKPIKDKGVNVPHITSTIPNYEHQIDLLHLPSDNGFRYLLVVVDIYDRKTVAAPLKNKNAPYVLKKLLELYSKKILILPKRLDVDMGTEFRGQFKAYMKDRNIVLRVAQPGRHRQQGVVERKNQQIGDALFKMMLVDEIKTGKESKKWMKYLPNVLKTINSTAKPLVKTYPSLKKEEPVCSGSSCSLLDIGTKVRRILDEPRSFHGKKLIGRFRSADIRWNPEISTILDISLLPGKPPLYYVNQPGHPNKILRVGYTKNQLQVVN